jgi:hypothetical protein
VLSALALVAIPRPAEACGGFFCSFAPVEQTGERIVFGVEPGKVTAHIQIDYQGEAEDFGWVVPVSVVPDFDVGPMALFQVLDGATAPSWYLQWTYEDESACGFWEFDQVAGAADGAATSDASAPESGVSIVFEEEVGPYNAKVLDAESADALLQWLEDHDFDLAPGSKPLIDHYLAIDMLFVAVKLTRDAEAGEIQPLVLEMATDTPCVPLVLTRVAAAPDMPIRTWILGDHRAVPMNWFEVAVNEAKIDWFGYGANYEEVARLAVDEAAGHGFITEYAGQLPDWLQLVYGSFDLVKLAGIHDPAQFLDEMFWQGFPADPTVQNLIRKHIPMPDPETLPEDCDDENEFYNWNKEECLAKHLPERFVFDPEGFASDLETRIVVPLEKAQEMLDKHAYVTRLYSSVSDFEMTSDPMFRLSPGLPDVSNQHTADATGKCTDDGQVVDVTVTLSDGRKLFFEGPVSPYGGWWGGDAPAFEDPVPGETEAATITYHGPSGDPVAVAHADVAAKDAEVAASDTTHVPVSGEEGIEAPPGRPDDGQEPPDRTPETPEASGEGPEDDGAPATKKGGGGGCGGGPIDAPSRAPWAAGMLALLVLAATRRRC